jgi:hypothetical protein
MTVPLDASEDENTQRNSEERRGGGDYLLGSCYIMLCYVMLCYVLLCCVALCCVMLCYVTLCYVSYTSQTSVTPVHVCAA